MTQRQKARVARLNPDALPCDQCGGGFGNVCKRKSGAYLCGDCDDENRILLHESHQEFGIRCDICNPKGATA